MPADRDLPRTGPRPRYGRIGAAATSVLVTLVAVLGGIGLLPVSSAAQPTAASGSSTGSPAATSAVPEGDTHDATGADAGAMSLSAAERTPRPSVGSTPVPQAPVVPAASGTGRRIVFDMSAQRVWLVGRRSGHDVTRRTYLVSGSVTDNLHPGTYSVYSRSEHATGIGESGTMRYMVRFTQGDNAAIGFHDIPVLDGRLVQTRRQLGSPQSHGCIRQWRPDARALWAFAPVGTTVVVVP